MAEDKQLKALLVGMIETNKALVDAQRTEIVELKKYLRSMTAEMAAVASSMNASNSSEAVKNEASVTDRSQFRLLESLANMMETFVYDPDNDTLDQSFEAWYNRYSGIIASIGAELTDKSRVELVLMKLESNANELYRNSLMPAKPSELSFSETIKRLTQLFKRKVSLLRTRWNCLQITRQASEDLAMYGARVNKMTEEFRLNELSSDQFKVLIFILGMRDCKDKGIRTRLLNLNDKTKAEDVKLQSMIEEAERILEIEKDSYLGSVPEAVNQVRTSSAAKNHHQRRANNKSMSNSINTKKAPRTPCWSCGGLHYARDCDYRDHVCSRCKNQGHKEGYCDALGNKKRTGNRQHQQQHSPKQNQNNRRVNIVQIPAVQQTADRPSAGRKFIDVFVNNAKVTLQYDTGSDVTILSEDSWARIGSPALGPSPCSPVDCQGNQLNVLGEATVSAELNGVVIKARCIVAVCCTDLFGIEWIDKFDLWHQPLTAICNKVSVSSDPNALMRELQVQFAPVFEKGLGTCADFKASLVLKPDARPVFRQGRPVPYHVMAMVSEELERLEQSGIIEPVQFSLFAAPIVVVKKANGTIRVCGDYSTGLNDMLQPHEYPIPTPEQIFASLANSKIFSQIDLSDAYLQIEMDEESRKLLTVNTHKGLFMFNRLCPGVKPAAGIFQQTMETILSGIQGVIIYFDDILVASADFDHHRSILLRVFERLTKFSLRVRLEKCNFFKAEVRYLGVIIDARGQRPDPEKVSAITSMPPPTNTSQARSFLGAIGFYGRFIKSMSTIRSPIDRLMRKDVPFDWDAACDSAFQKFKEILLSDLLLCHYNPALPLMIAADASSTGIGCVAYHTFPDGSVKAFYHASRRLTATEQRYAQIEKEALGIIFAVKKFHKYIWGRRFTIFTDHRPLLSIFGSHKGVPVHTANRLQRWAIILLGYDFEIKFIGTDDFGHADILSRLIADQPRSQEDIIIAQVIENEEAEVIAREFTKFSSISFSIIQEETRNDPVLQQVMKFVINGWPDKSTIITKDVQKFVAVRDGLSITNNILSFRDRTVVPLRCRPRILQMLHNAHPGIVRMKSLARCYAYWPGIDNEIKSVVEACSSCQAALKAPKKTCLSSWPTPPRPWFRAHADFAGPINGLWYLLIVDAYSKWPEVFTMATTTTTATVKALRETCARHGSMEKLVTDNGPQFASSSFEEFCNREMIEHIRTAPYMPMSNGQVERFVDSFKRALAKSRKINEEVIQEFLRSYRATPNERAPFGLSPAELIYGRRIRLPISTILPPLEDANLVRDRKMEDQFNTKHGAERRSFCEGDKVQIRTKPGSAWRDACIIEPIGAVMYNVLAAGRVLRVHANQTRRRTVLTLDAAADLAFDGPITSGINRYTPTPPPQEAGQSSPAKRISPRANWRAVSRSSPVNLRPRK